MAKRAPLDSKPFTALDKGLAASVMNPTPQTAPEPQPAAENTPAAPVQSELRAQAPTPAAVRIENPPIDPPPVAPERREPLPKPQRQPVSQPRAAAAGELSQKEKLSREKRVLLTLSEEREIERCVDRIAEGFGGTPVKLSHIIRACLAVVRHGEGEIIRRAQEAGQLTRPPNGDVMALAEFEHELSKVLSQAFRDAPLIR